MRLRWILSQPLINKKQARSLLCPLLYETLPSFVERREERLGARCGALRPLLVALSVGALERGVERCVRCSLR